MNARSSITAIAALAAIGAMTTISLISSALNADPSSVDASPPALVFATVSCAKATKPGRIRCRAALELPLDSLSTRRLVWGELVVLAAGPGVTPLRGRLGPYDAEARDEARLVWSFSVAASQVGERELSVALRATVAPKPSGPETPVERVVTTTVKVAP